MYYNPSCRASGNGAFFFSNADDFNNSIIVGKAPLISGLSSRQMLDTSAASEGLFVMARKGICQNCGTDDRYKDGRCKVCTGESNRKWQREHPENIRRNAREYRKRHPEKARGSVQKWHEENPQKVREKDRRWQRENRERINGLARERYKKDPSKIIASVNIRRTRKTEAGGSYTAAEWKALKKQYGGRCLCCGKKGKLTADHVVPVIKGGTSDISNLQPLCKPCNSSKGDKATDYRTKPGILRWIQERLL